MRRDPPGMDALLCRGPSSPVLKGGLCSPGVSGAGMGRWRHRWRDVRGSLPCCCPWGERVKAGVGKDQGSARVWCLLLGWTSPSSSLLRPQLVPVVLAGQVPEGLARFFPTRFEIGF